MSQQSSSRVRSTAHRQDRCKTSQDHERSPKADGSSNISSSIDGTCEESCRRDGHRHQHDAASGNSCDSRETERRQNSSAAGIPGSIGPGAEPPVAVACHAFAQKRTDRRSDSGEAVMALSCGQQESEGEALEGDIDGVDAVFQAECQGGLDDSTHGDTVRRRQRQRAAGNEDSSKAFCSGVESTDNGEEADTLPDSFSFSDECGPEGASTGRIDNADCEPSYFGSVSSAKHSRRRHRPSDSASNSSECHSTSECEEEEASIVSERSESLSSPPRRNPRFGRRTAAPPRPLLAMTRNRRIVPSEFDMSAAEGEGRRRRRTGRRGRRYRSPPSRRARGSEAEGEGGRRRAGMGRDRLAQTETESVSGFRQYEVEVARLRQENEILKQRQEQQRPRKNNEAVEPWYRYADEPASWESPSGSTRRQEVARLNTKDMDPLAREHVVQDKHIQRERPLRGVARVSHPLTNDCGTVWPDGRAGSPAHPSTTCWSDFVSKSHSSRPKGAAWGVESPAGVDLSLPRALVDGGFLWKIPYHSAGTPKRRWFQIKPADGLLTTASGRLVVRPVEGRGVDNHAFGDRGGYGSDDSRPAMSMVHIRAAWPLTFIWMDPERDLEKSPPREIRIEDVLDVARGHTTPAFWQQAAHRGLHTLPAPELCFSLVGRDRTLDLAAESLSEAKGWIRALNAVALRVKEGHRSGESTFHTAVPVSQTAPGGALLCYHQPTGNTPAGHESHRETAEPMARSPRAQKQSHVSSPVKAPPNEDESAQSPPLARAAEDSRGADRAWSADTIHAWRRRLFPAVSRGDATRVAALFEQGCPVDLVETGTGDTALLLACRLGDIGIVGECLRRGSRNDPHPDFGQTALQAAVAAGQEACARLLLETAAPSRCDTVVSNHQDPNRETPLHTACRRGYGGIVEALLHHGADMRLVDRHGNTPLHGAASGGNAGALASLLDAGGDAVLEERNARGNRALHGAAAAGHVACVQLLLGTAAEPDVPNADGQTPFALASIGGHLAVTRLIKQYAPAAGGGAISDGGDARSIKASDEGGGGARSTISDALPRPHGGGPWSNGDLEHRCYSAASLGRRRNDPHEVLSTRLISHNTGQDGVGEVRSGGGFFQEGDYDGNRSSVQEDPNTFSTRRSAEPRDDPLAPPPECGGSSAPAHGSLFDGLQVYVVGGRQPLGSQQRATMAGAGLTQTTTAAPGSAPLSQNYNSQAMSSTSTWGDAFLTAPSTMAPSPPHGDDPMAFLSGNRGSSTAAIPGSARALARMIHFSNTRAADGERDATGAGELTLRGGKMTSIGDRSELLRSSEGYRRGGALGPWMTYPGNHSRLSSSGAPQQTAAAHANLAPETGAPRASKHNVMSEQLAEMATGTDGSEQANESFVMGPSEQGEEGPTLLPGLWHVCYSQGYPYYLHEASGHSQWEDPRRAPLSQEPSASTTKIEPARTQKSSERSSERFLETESAAAAAAAAAGQEEKDEEDIVEATGTGAPREPHIERLGAATPALQEEVDQVESTTAEHVERLPVSPIKPVGVTVIVEVSRFTDAASTAGAASPSSVGVAVDGRPAAGVSALRRSGRIALDGSGASGDDTGIISINDGIDSFASPERPGGRKSGRDEGESSPPDDRSIDARDGLTACADMGGHEASDSRGAEDGAQKRSVDGIGGGFGKSVADTASNGSVRGECRRDAGDRKNIEQELEEEAEEEEEEAWWQGLDVGSDFEGGNDHGEEQGAKGGGSSSTRTISDTLAAEGGSLAR